jgi:hypothetical protein
MTKLGAAFLAITIILAGAPDLCAQQRGGSDPEHRLPLTWDRWLDHAEMGERMKLMADTWPDFLTLQSLGQSYGQRSRQRDPGR